MGINSDIPGTSISIPGRLASDIQAKRLQERDRRRMRIGMSLTDASELDVSYAQELLDSGKEAMTLSPKGIFYSDRVKGNGRLGGGSVMDGWDPTTGRLSGGRSIASNWDPATGRLSGGRSIASNWDPATGRLSGGRSIADDWNEDGSLK